MTFQNPTHECDIVMKGGITSGVVYPEGHSPDRRGLSSGRRLGGTSAGAIAAAFAAAAEFDRGGGGFERLETIPAELNENLMKLFQPLPRHRKSFDKALELARKGKNPLAGLRQHLVESQDHSPFRAHDQEPPRDVLRHLPGSEPTGI